MAKRTTARRLAMQALYQAESANIGIDEALENIFSAEEKLFGETKSFAEKLAREAWADRADSDKVIEEFAIDWPLERIGKVDRGILRLAVHEIRSKETPASVVADEAVELAKKYSSPEAAKFINGILGSYLRKSP
ncbi:transcription antitermination factor NusB [candidate division WOR-1 bacterium RIFCSPHIGHO2_01_FULL_53_15]|uniref:Transcription antitermination protein NusB n=1 Tax=candidate division WOR-1 bacterium RIFCSPHIGHO2_01_FULL_53_15 TaxID=1802564 RepID=A0A1F4Q1P3_UNCSA|nr:MAG: transcription antitermination factor NusB [candidate division WOR-1 bacterium RIFCSPHIGHO2_01_FULL_53_15]OGC10658.1 MAG: transcription antitermination factor NusB [candidate division WOR-1 bacterium RIFCSPHIGHO2_02_FULL_53_26]